MSALRFVRRLALSALAALSLAAAAPVPLGRLTLVEGPVGLRVAGQDLAAVPNTLLGAGSTLWTGPGGRAEVVALSLALRLDGRTTITLARLDPQLTLIQFGQGVIDLRLGMPALGRQVEVATARGTVALVQAGRYRIDAGQPDAAGRPAPLVLTVLEGQARLSGPRATVDVVAGEQAVVSGDPMTIAMGQAWPTPFDDWARQRDFLLAPRPVVRVFRDRPPIFLPRALPPPVVVVIPVPTMHEPHRHDDDDRHREPEHTGPMVFRPSPPLDHPRHDDDRHHEPEHAGPTVAPAPVVPTPPVAPPRHERQHAGPTVSPMPVPPPPHVEPPRREAAHREPARVEPPHRDEPHHDTPPPAARKPRMPAANDPGQHH